MENTDLLKSQLEVDNVGSNYLLETAKWGKFLAIAGFVFTALIVILGLYMSVALGSISGYYGRSFSGLGPLIGILYIGFGALYFFPCLFLYRFSTKMKMALASSDQETLNEALNQQRRMYKFVGILTMIMYWDLYVLILVFGGLAVMFRYFI